MAIKSGEEAIEAAKTHLAEHARIVGSSDLDAAPFERGWLVGLKSAAETPLGQVRVGGLVLIVDHDGSIERSSASLPPPVAITRYMARHRG